MPEKRYYPRFTCPALPPAFYTCLKQVGQVHGLRDREVVMLAVACLNHMQVHESTLLDELILAVQREVS